MKLSNKDIDATMREIEDFLTSVKVAQKDKVQLCFLIEEALLRYQEHLGDWKNFNFEIYTKKWLDSPKIILRIKGVAFNPLKEEDSIIPAAVMRNLLQYEGTGTAYRYENGYNEITFYTLREQRSLKIPGGNVTISILLAALFAIPARLFLPPETQTFLVDSLAAPIFRTLMNLILAVNVPLIFISIVSSICAMEDIATLSNIGVKIVRRFFLTMVGIILTATCVSTLIFPEVVTLENAAAAVGISVLDMLLAIVPTNTFEAFAEGNVLQIVTIAILLSVCMIMLGEKVSTLKQVIGDGKFALFKMMELVLKLLPLAIFLIEFKLLMTTTLAEILSVWRIVAAALLTYAVFSAFLLIRLAFKYKVSVPDFLKKISPVLVIAFTVLSGAESMAANFEVCKKNLKLDEKLCNFWIPLSHSLLAPGTAVTLVVYAFFAAYFSGATLSVTQLLLLAFLAIQLSIFSPKVNGGIVAVLTLLLNHFGLPLEAIGAIMLGDVFIINASSVFGMLARDCELFDVSHEINFKGKLV